MPLILAIEPDKKQASQLTAIVRGRLHAELILGDTADRALAALGTRVPDLILTSALLSPKDETALGERLRALDAAAAHVHALTTPVLASPNGRGLTGGRASGVLSALRREKAAPATLEGCDPAMFAEQCREYLERAATEREAMAERAAEAADRRDAAPLVEPDLHVEDDVPIVAGTFDQPITETTEYVEPFDARYDERAPVYVAPEPNYATSYAESFVQTASPEPFAFAAAAPSVEPVTEPAFEPVVASVVAAPPPDAQPDRRSFVTFPDEGPASLLAAVAALAAEEERAAIEPALGEPRDAAPLHVADDEPAVEEPREAGDDAASYGFVDLDLSDLLDPPGTRRDREERAAAFAQDDESVSVYELDPMTLAEFEAAVPRIVVQRSEPEPESEPEETWSETALYTPLPRAHMLRWPTMTIAADAPRPVVVVAEPPDEMKEWLDIIEALRRDAAMEPRPRVTAPPTPEDPFDDASGVKRRRRSLDSPAQDEWGFFDPEQCGFQALLAKLEEITDQDDRRTPRA